MKKQTSKNKSRALKSAGPSQPPPVKNNLTTNFTLRFTTTGIGGTSFVQCQVNNLLDAWLIAGTATTAYQLFDFVKVRRVSVWASPDLNGSGFAPSTTVSVEFPGLVAGSFAGGNQRTDTVVGTARAAHVSLAPGRFSQAAQFQAASNNTLFVVRITDQNGNMPVGAIIDVEVSYRNATDVNPAAIASPITGATPGLLYFGGLDGGRLAATKARSVFDPRI